ncbi:hypothetical protein BHF71_10265 [Vulcanibacillus modesticaldus]|uniref:S1 motif domain-containing protein n=1 Tax=Vulcanibacillus modesticaldus TaxID=337097 RepID=A0A1D2YTK3_9BACI|nr:S1-like domain-containing RNA-binding protein [Vulcanibacillus modesticaldus]OEF99006.1 hypothetical protein BHF71_10265 [Vulcanibacillus modesticaldus]
MKLVTGRYHLLTVERESPFGYFLSNGEEDVLLHYSETDGRKIKIGEKINVFLYNDHKGRIAATLAQPKIQLDEVDFLEVKDFQPKMGYFLDNQISKQVLLPISELPEDKRIWPESGDWLLVKLVHDKQKRLLAALVKDEVEIKEYIKKKKGPREDNQLLDKKTFIEGTVIHHLSMGTQIYLENNQIGFLHRSERLSELRLGQRIMVRVSYIREDGKLNLSMKPLKEVSRIEDADKILEILVSRGGAMPYWDKTPPDIIKEKFNLSKSAFKRALGKLMKDGLIYQEEGWTYLKNKNEL